MKHENSEKVTNYPEARSSESFQLLSLSPAVSLTFFDLKS